MPRLAASELGQHYLHVSPRGIYGLKRVKDSDSSWLRSLKYILNTPGKRAMSLPHCHSNKVKLLPIHVFSENITMLFDPHNKHLRQFWFETKELVDLQNSRKTYLLTFL